jgi:tetratricopeptide (TPR) repeat protein
MRARPAAPAAAACIAFLAFVSCRSVPTPSPSPSSSPLPAASPTVAALPDGAEASAKPKAGETESLAASIEREIVRASPASLAKARELVRQNRVEGSEQGRAMLYAIERIFALVYVDSPADTGISDPPPLNAIVRVLNEAAAGRWPEESARSGGTLTSLLSAFVVLSKTTEQIRGLAMAELDKLESAGVASLLIPYLRGRNAEAGGNVVTALTRYGEARAMDASCYPASLGYARCLYALGRYAEAIEALKPVYEAYPADRDAARYLARSYYSLGRYLSAAPIVQDILRTNPTEDEFLLMRAHILVAGGAYGQAGPLLDAYATKHPRDPLYLYLRIIYAWKERKAGLNALDLADSALALYPDDPGFLRAKAEIILETAAPGSPQRAEAVAALEAILSLNPRDVDALALLCAEAASGGNGQRAFSLLQELLKIDPGFSDYSLKVKAALGAKRTDFALRWAEEWMASDPASDDAVASYVRALVDVGNSAEAMARIKERLAGKASPKARSLLLFYRSRLQKDPEAALSDLRSSLLEDPANMEALLAMFDLSFAQKDYKKARFYLRQAQSVSPADESVVRRQASLEGVAGQ